MDDVVASCQFVKKRMHENMESINFTDALANKHTKITYQHRPAIYITNVQTVFNPTLGSQVESVSNLRKCV